jgi:hypothetical protein
MPKGTGSVNEEPLTPVSSPPTALAEELEPMQEAKAKQQIAATTKSRLFVFIIELLNRKS